MGIFNFRNKKEIEHRELEYITPCSQALQFGEYYNKYSSMNLSAVYSATELIANNIAMLPIRVRQKNGEHVDDIVNHPLNLLFKDNNNNNISTFNIFKLIVSSVILKGNAFCYINRAADGTPISLRWLPSQNVTIDYNKDKDTLWYYSSLVSPKKIDPKDMLHFLKNTYDGVNGLSVISFATRTLDLSNGAENSAKNFFSNGCNLSGIITVQSQLTAKQKEDIRLSWAQTYGQGGSGVGVLQGNMTYQPISVNATDAQLLQTRQYNVQDIARFFNISPMLIGDLSHNAYGTVEAMQNIFIAHTLSPWIYMIEAELNRKLVNDDSIYIDLNQDALRMQDKQSQGNYYTSMIQSGIMCINEVRKEMGLSPIEGGGKHVIPFTDVNQNTINSNNMENKEGN